MWHATRVFTANNMHEKYDIASNVLFYMRKAKTRNQTLTHTLISQHTQLSHPKLCGKFFFPFERHTNTHEPQKFVLITLTHCIDALLGGIGLGGTINIQAQMCRCVRRHRYLKKHSPRDQGIHHTREQRRNPRLQ